MPTQFTECDECNYLDFLGIDHEFNKRHKGDLERQQILMEKGLPKEIAEYIIKLSKAYGQCSDCNIKLCSDVHYIRAANWGRHYRNSGTLCNQCCWFEVS